MTDIAVVMPDGFEFSDDRDRVDRQLVYRWLSEEAYWALGRPRSAQDTAIDSSRNYGIYRVGGGEQVAYARVVTDGATFGWLCDVFVDSSVRGLGIGTALMSGITTALEPLNLPRVLLATSDAHGLYAKFGFQSLAAPDRWMWRPAP